MEYEIDEEPLATWSNNPSLERRHDAPERMARRIGDVRDPFPGNQKGLKIPEEDS